MILASVAAILAAGLFAVASAFQHRSAGLIPAQAGTLPRFVVATARHPLWIVGTVADVAGLALHALALRDGPLTLVQPLLVSTLVFALPLRQLMVRRRPSRGEVLWAAALTAGLVVFLTSATPADRTAGSPDTIPTVLAIALVAGGMAGCGVIGARLSGDRSAAVLGAGAGLGFAGTAGLIKETMDQLHHGLPAVLGSWPLYALLAAGGIGLLLNQLAYRAAPLRASLPAVMTVDPIGSLVIGVAVFDEHFRRTPLALTGEVVGLAVVLAAVVTLTRRDPTLGSAESAREREAAPPADGHLPLPPA